MRPFYVSCGRSPRFGAHANSAVSGLPPLLPPIDAETEHRAGPGRWSARERRIVADPGLAHVAVVSAGPAERTRGFQCPALAASSGLSLRHKRVRWATEPARPLPAPGQGPGREHPAVADPGLVHVAAISAGSAEQTRGFQCPALAASSGLSLRHKPARWTADPVIAARRPGSLRAIAPERLCSTMSSSSSSDISMIPT